MASVCCLNKVVVRDLVSSWVSRGDPINFVGFALNDCKSALILHSDSSGVLAGSPFVDALFTEFGCNIEWHLSDGDLLQAGGKVATIKGSAFQLMSYEKLAITILSRASSIATTTKKLRKILTDVSWKGQLRVHRSLTPGFELVEEHAMVLAGVVPTRPSIFIRQCHASSAGGIEKAIESIRSKAGMTTKLEVECATLSEALAASAAGANIIVFNKLPLKELGTSITQVKGSYPHIQVQLNGDFDESNLRAVALSNVDLLSTSKLSSGFSHITFSSTYDDFGPENLPDTERFASPSSTKLQPSSSDHTNEVSSPSAPSKKLRLNEDNQSASPKSESKQNGTQSRTQTPTGSGSQATMSREQNLKRPQRNQRSQHNSPRQNVSRPQSSGGMHLLQMTRFSSPNASSRASNSPQQPGSSSANQLPSMLSSQSSSRMMHNHPSNSGMLGSGFLNMSAQPSNSPSSWSMASGPMMGNTGFGPRMGGPPGYPMSTCRACGTTNGLGSPFCRTCRVPLR
ncbi:unnamed protein product [Dicrocoelium dendriticum]|nr:unnamed protein product [Dicrocoelium dendriticum]